MGEDVVVVPPSAGVFEATFFDPPLLRSTRIATTTVARASTARARRRRRRAAGDWGSSIRVHTREQAPPAPVERGHRVPARLARRPARWTGAASVGRPEPPEVTPRIRPMVTTAPSATPFRVADLSLADFGRKEIDLAEV